MVVLGGYGFFGRMVRDGLAGFGLKPLAASRRAAAELRVDVDDPGALRAGDVVVDTVGPFQDRSTVLIEAAIDKGFDVIDISDALAYTERVLALEERIAAAGISVLNASSTVSALAAAVVRLSGIDEPVRVSGFLAPRTKQVANRGASVSLLRSVGRPIRVWRGGRLATVPGFRETRRFPMPAPIGRFRGGLFESADALWLPRIWPSLQTAELFLDPRTRGLGFALRLAARVPAVRALLEVFVGPGSALSRRFGPATGGLGYEIEAKSDGRVARLALLAPARGYYVPVAPAVLAARAIAEGRFEPRGLVPPDRHVEPDELVDYLRSVDVEVMRIS